MMNQVINVIIRNNQIIIVRDSNVSSNSFDNDIKWWYNNDLEP